MPQRYQPSGHQAFGHDSLASVAYDWERVGDPEVRPRWPFKVYLPRGTDDVVRAIAEARERGERLVVRAHGHSSNDLVTAEGGAVLLTQLMDQVMEVDEDGFTCTMQAGAALADVDAHLAERGLGLAVIGDHADITAGGFASVGGISPASHRYGLFVDTVVELEYVDWDGQVHRCSRTREPERFLRVLAGTGRHGVITTLTVAVIRADKDRTVLRNHRFITTSMDEFLERSGRLVRDPGEAVLARGLWVDLGKVRIGQFSAYHHAPPRRINAVRNAAAYACQRMLGRASTRLRPPLGEVAKYFATASLLFPPAYASMRNVERFADKVLDATVGQPTRWLVVLAPADGYERVFRELMELCAAERRDSGAITFISGYVKPIRSAYLSGGAAGTRHCELLLYLGVDPERMTDKVLELLVERIDDLAIEHGALRYMHSRTTADPERRRLVDPNARYVAAGGDVDIAVTGASEG